VNHYEANRILDRVREGQQFSHFVITRALELTGDYEAHGSIGMDQAFQEESYGGGQRRSPLLVSTSDSGHSQETWAKSR